MQPVRKIYYQLFLFSYSPDLRTPQRCGDSAAQHGLLHLPLLHTPKYNTSQLVLRRKAAGGVWQCRV